MFIHLCLWWLSTILCLYFGCFIPEGEVTFKWNWFDNQVNWNVTRLCFLMENNSFESSVFLFKREITDQVRHTRVAIREKDERQFVKCCLNCPRRLAAKHTQEGNTKSDICIFAASTMFALSRQSHMKQDSKGEIQLDSLLYCHGNSTLMKSRKTIKYKWKKGKPCCEYLWSEKGTLMTEFSIVTCGWLLIQNHGYCFWEMLI